MKLKRYSFLILAIVLIVGANTIMAVAGDEPAPVEILEARTRTSKTYTLGGDKYALDVSLGSIHYKDDMDDPGELWKDIDTTITNSTKLEWDWEVVKGNWHLLINGDTTVALGKSGHWLAFRYVAFGYLDWSTKEYVILQNREDVTPVLNGNRITWPGIFHGATLEYIYSADGFKENLYITQQTRDWLTANPPSSYGLDNQTSYLVGAMRCDWQSAYQAEREDGTAINWTNAQEFVNSGIFWRHPIKDKIVSALPIGYAYHEGLGEDDQVKIRYRFFTQDGYHYLLFGAKVLDLNAMPPGTIIIDPTVDEQVGAGNDDAMEFESAGNIFRTGTKIFHYSSTVADGRYWGAHRWVSGSFPAQGDTIDVAYIELYCYGTASDDINGNWHFDKSASPPEFSTATYDITGRTRTTASVSWIANSLGSGFKQSPSLVTPLQEVIDNYSPTAIVAIFRPNTNTAKHFETRSYNDNSFYGAKLHIEYTVAAAPAGWSWGEVIG